MFDFGFSALFKMVDHSLEIVFRLLNVSRFRQDSLQNHRPKPCHPFADFWQFSLIEINFFVTLFYLSILGEFEVVSASFNFAKVF